MSSAFVMKNERQLPESVRSANSGCGTMVKAVYVDHVHEVPNATASYVDGLATELSNEATGSAQMGRLRVDVLGRYNFDRQLMPANSRSGVDLRFRTVQSSKDSRPMMS